MHPCLSSPAAAGGSARPLRSRRLARAMPCCSPMSPTSPAPTSPSAAAAKSSVDGPCNLCHGCAPVTGGFSEPVVTDTSAVGRQLVPGIEAVEVADGYRRYRLGFGKAHIDGAAATPVLAHPLSTPVGYTATRGTEVELDAAAPDVALRLAGDLHAFTLIVVDPEYPVSPTHGAVAGRRRLGLYSKLPLDGSAVTGSFDHETPPMEQ